MCCVYVIIWHNQALRRVEGHHGSPRQTTATAWPTTKIKTVTAASRCYFVSSIYLRTIPLGNCNVYILQQEPWDFLPPLLKLAAQTSPSDLSTVSSHTWEKNNKHKELDPTLLFYVAHKPGVDLPDSPVCKRTKHTRVNERALTVAERSHGEMYLNVAAVYTRQCRETA